MEAVGDDSYHSDESLLTFEGQPDQGVQSRISVPLLDRRKNGSPHRSALLPADKQCRVRVGNLACPPQAVAQNLPSLTIKRVRHVGPVEVTAGSQEEALKKMRGELRYRLEICPCTGEMYQDVEIEISANAGA